MRFKKSIAATFLLVAVLVMGAGNVIAYDSNDYKNDRLVQEADVDDPSVQALIKKVAKSIMDNELANTERKRGDDLKIDKKITLTRVLRGAEAIKAAEEEGIPAPTSEEHSELRYIPCIEPTGHAFSPIIISYHALVSSAKCDLYSIRGDECLLCGYMEEGPVTVSSHRPGSVSGCPN